MCVLHLTCEQSCRGRQRGSWIPPGLIDLVDTWSSTLARNLRDAGALCATFREGSDHRMRMMLDVPVSEDWSPGCGRGLGGRDG
jgi:hypothetical protein